MKEESLLLNIDSKKLERLKMYITLMDEIEFNEVKHFFTEEEIELIKAEFEMFPDMEELCNKLDRIIRRREKKPSTGINSILPIEEYGPFPKEVEKVLRNNLIDNMDDLLTRNIDLNCTNTDTKEYIKFMKKFYDFSNLDNSENNLTKTK